MPEAATTTPSAPSAPAPVVAEVAKPTTQSTIHDAVEALFAEKETPAAPAAQPEAQPAPESEAPAEGEQEQPKEEPKTEEAPKVSASDLAIEIARAKKALARAKQAKPAEQPSQLDPAVIKRAQAMAAAGGDEIAQFEAAGFDLAKLVQLYDNRAAENPDFADPLAKKVSELAAQIAKYEERESAAKDAEAVSNFMSEAEKFAQSAEETNFVAALAPLGGLENVKQRVIEAAEKGQKLSLVEAVKSAEKDLEEVFEAIAKTPKGKKIMARLFPQMPKSPGVPAQSPKTGTAPEPKTTPTTVTDVINNAIDALGIE